MSYFNLSGVPIDVSSCWPQNKALSENAAQEINSVIDKFPNETSLASEFQNIMQEAKDAGLCPFIPGDGDIIERSHEVLNKARTLLTTPAEPKPQPQQPAIVEAKAKIKQKSEAPSRPALALPYNNGCPNTHFKATDSVGDYCSPCPTGQLFYQGSCKVKPPACECNLPRTGDPDFGQCPPAPTACGPAPQHQQCNVPGYGMRPVVCKCGKWQCPTTKDLLIEKFKREGKPIPPGLAGSTDTNYSRLLLVAGVALLGYYLFSR